MLDLFISATAMAVTCFTLLNLLVQPANTQPPKPFIGLLVCLFFFASGPVVFKLSPALIQFYVSLIPALFFLYLPLFWFYHDAMISQETWQWDGGMKKHFVSPLLALLLCINILILPAEDFNSMFFSDHQLTSTRLKIVALCFFIAVVLWCFMSVVYAVGILRRTRAYQRKLKDVFAEDAGKRLDWVVLISLLTIFTWCYALLVLAFEDKFTHYGFSETGVLLVLSSIIWIVSLNGLRQRPGFEAIQSPSETHPIDSNKKSYQRSTLKDEDLDKISKKIKEALAGEKAHLDPDLNLPKLSKIIGEPTQYISQTLSQRLDTTFFDLINQARIKEAKQQLIDTSNSVLDIAIACGFNSRSSFYKAFKFHTDQTPSQYRKANN